jgi:hypothetical protein
MSVRLRYVSSLSALVVITSRSRGDREDTMLDKEMDSVR